MSHQYQSYKKINLFWSSVYKDYSQWKKKENLEHILKENKKNIYIKIQRIQKYIIYCKYNSK